MLDRDEKIGVFGQKLAPFLPAETETYVAAFLIEHRVHFTVSKGRKTKLGDYRHPWQGQPHRISVNGNLNRYAFLVTTLHEMAHLTTWKKYGNRVKPHGQEWKDEFKTIAKPVLDQKILPEDVTLSLTNYLRNAKASSCTDDRLYRVLKRYDKKKGTTVEQLIPGATFQLNGKIFVKGKKLRTRYECKELPSQKMYRVLGLAEVVEIQQ